MLVEFSVENYRSIREKVTLDMRASTSIKDHIGNVFSSGIDQEGDLLAVVPIYGLNGSGKTTLLRALDSMHDIILYSNKHSEGDTFDIEPFLLDLDSRHRPTTFEIVFIHDSVKYEYRLSVDTTRVMYERLVAYEPQKQVWFERNYNSTAHSYEWKFGPNFKGEKESIKNRTPKNILFFSQAVINDHKQLIPINRYLRTKLLVVPNTHTDCEITDELAQTPEGKSKILSLMRRAELIDDFQIKEREITDEEIPDFFPDSVRQMIKKRPHYEEKTVHNIPGTDESVVFDLSDESSGTIKLFHLAGPIIQAISNGGILVIDELDRNLHCLLLSVLIDLFNNENENRKGAQLVFTTHNPVLFETNDLRRDQIWFASRNNEKSTILYNLSELTKHMKDAKPVRKGQSLLKGFLQKGRFYSPPEFINKQLSLFDLR